MTTRHSSLSSFSVRHFARRGRRHRHSLTHRSSYESTTIEVTGHRPQRSSSAATGFAPSPPHSIEQPRRSSLSTHARSRHGRRSPNALFLGYEVATADHPDAEAGRPSRSWPAWVACGHLSWDARMQSSPWAGATTDMAGFVAATWLRGVTLINDADHAARHVDTSRGRRKPVINHGGQKPGSAPSTRPTRSSPTPGLLASLPPPGPGSGGRQKSSSVGYRRPRDPHRGEVLPEILLDPPASSWLRSLPAITVKALSRPDRRRMRESSTMGTPSPTRSNERTTTWRHGIAVAKSTCCCFAARLSARAGSSGLTKSRYGELFARVGYPRYEGSSLRRPTSLASDKKVRRGICAFVLLDGVACPKHS